jgi:hypothetical protein
MIMGSIIPIFFSIFYPAEMVRQYLDYGLMFHIVVLAFSLSSNDITASQNTI